jgi:predicted peroxiredoxin
MRGKQVLYVQTSGLDAIERAYAPFILAIAAAAAGTRATIYFFLKGVTCLKRSELAKTRLEGYPSLDQIVDQAVRAGVMLEACEQSCALFGLQKQDLIEHVQIVGPPVLNDRLLAADGVLSF